jgi:hypothetical protein
VRLVLASELYAFAYGFDHATVIKSTVQKICQVTAIPLIVCTDSKSLYQCMVKLSTTQEKRLMVDVMAMRQSYERRIITKIRLIKGDSNPADAMTKAKANTSLTRLIDTNKIDTEAEQWVERDTDKAINKTTIKAIMAIEGIEEKEC